jgi:hypothetical protein
MKTVTKRTIAGLAVLVLLGLGSWLYLWMLTNEYTEELHTSNQSIEQLKKQWAEVRKENLTYKAERNKFTDSITGLKVEKGLVEIELNRKVEELKNANSLYKQSRVVKDTARALNICDSIVIKYIPGILSINLQKELLGDSLVEAYEEWTNRQDSIIQFNFNRTDSSLTSQIKEKTEEAKKTKRENRQRDKRLLKAGGIGVAIGVILTLLLGG